MLDKHIFFDLVSGFREWFTAHRAELEAEFAVVGPVINAQFGAKGSHEDDMDLMDYALETFNEPE